MADALPVLTGAGVIPLQAPDIAALEQGRHGIRRLGQHLFDIRQCSIEAIERAMRRGAINKRVNPPRIRLQYTIEVRHGLVEISRRCGDL